VNYITERWNKNDYKHQQLFTSFKQDSTLKFIDKTKKRKKNKQRWVSQAKETYKGDINMVDEAVEGQLAATPFPDEMLPLSRNWSMLTL
jgi:hypothetical protein